MKKDPNKFLNEKVDIETERQILGEALYNIKDEIPSFILEKDEKLEVISFMGWIKGFHTMCDQFGSDITHLFAELTLLYKIKEESDLEDEQKNSIRLNFLIIRGLLSHAMLQSHQIIEAVEDWDQDESAFQNFEIKGADYYFIPIVLNNLWGAYSMLLTFMIKKVYLNIEFIESIRERLNYLISPQFEDFRRTFKVAECWEIKQKSEENPITLH